MGKSKSVLRRRHETLDGPALIECPECGHRATTRSRGMPALGVADLVGKVLRCSACGYRMRFDDTAQGQALKQAALAEVFEQASPSEAVH